MANSNKNKSDWLSRFRYLSIRRAPANHIENMNNTEAVVVYRRGVHLDNNDNSGHYTRTPNSFCKGIIKMHTRMKNVFRHKRDTNRHTIAVASNPVSSNSHLQPRVTLNSTVQNAENLYSLEPVKLHSDGIGVADHFPRILHSSSSSEDLESLNNSAIAPVIPPRKRNLPQLSEIPNGRVPKNEIANLSNFYWYWGPISRTQAEERLKDSPDGAFLVRDSASDRYLFTMSFRSIGKILHTRIEFSKSGYSLFDQVGYNSIQELVEDAVSKSKCSVYCYTKTKDHILPNFPIRLTLPVSRYDKVPSLKYLSRFVIRQSVIVNDMEKLPLPLSLINYLQEDGPYF